MRNCHKTLTSSVGDRKTSRLQRPRQRLLWEPQRETTFDGPCMCFVRNVQTNWLVDKSIRLWRFDDFSLSSYFTNQLVHTFSSACQWWYISQYRLIKTLVFEDFTPSWENWENSFKIFRPKYQVLAGPYYGKLSRNYLVDVYILFTQVF